MEDHKQSRPQPGAEKEEKILDLTKDMEMADQDKHKIYDLSEGSTSPAVSNAGKRPLSPPPPVSGTESSPDAVSETDATVESQPAPDENAQLPQNDAPKKDPPTPITESTSVVDDQAQTAPKPEEEMVADTPTEEPATNTPPSSLQESTSSDAETLGSEPAIEKIEMPEESSREPEIELSSHPGEPPLDEVAEAPVAEEHAEDEGTTSIIEDEVDAAFNAVQSDPSPPEPEEETKDQLFDKLSGITEMVDNAVREINDNEAPSDEPIPEVNEDNLAADAAELEAVISGEDEDEIIELTEIVDPSEVVSAEQSSEGNDDDIIDLVDIVDPAELERTQDAQDDIGYSGETQPSMAKDSEEDAVSEPSPSLSEAPDTPTLQEEELALSDLDEFDLNEEVEDSEAQSDDLDTTEIDKLFADDDLVEADQHQDEVQPDIDQENEDDEQVILLTDVLKKGPEGQEAPPEAETQEEDTAENFASPEPDTDIPGSVPAPPMTKELEDLSSRDIETAVEHILKTKYADTIERLVADAVKKAVTREVETIKRSLTDEDEPPA